MAEKTKIEWTDHTFNPWRGCMKVHAGCAHCYAESQSKRNPGMLGVWGDSGTRVVGSEEMWSQPGKWNKAAEKSGERRRVFCASMADVFEDWAGPLTNANGHVLFPGNCLTNPWRDSGNPETEKPLTLNDVRRRLFALIDETPWLDWQLLTKRPENVRKMWPITPSPGSSPGVSIPFSENASIRVLRRMLRSRDAEIDAMKRGYIWLNESDKTRLSRLDNERRMIRERIKELGKKETA